MRYQFDIELHDLTMSIPYEVTAQIVWKKGKAENYFDIFKLFYILNT